MSGRIELPFERNFTSMHNYHFHDKSLSLKAIGLLSFMFSLPSDWDYSIRGLAACVKDGVDSIRATLIELEEAGYVIRKRVRDARGRLGGTDYVVYPMPQEMLYSKGFLPKRENPILDKNRGGSPILDFPILENPTLENPTQEKPILGKPTQENPTQLSTNRVNTNLTNNESINHSLNAPIDRMIEDVRNRIGYNELVLDCDYEVELIDTIVELIVEAESSRSIYTRIGTRDVSTSMVKRKLRDLTPDIVRDGAIEPYYKYAMDNTISNPRALMLSFLYNATATYGLGNLASEAQAAAVSVRTHIPD